MSTSKAEIFVELAAPFPAKEIEWRIQRKSNDGNKAAVIPYLTARCVMDRLDEAVGPENWQDSYRAGPGGGIVCTLSVRIDGEWIAKEDGAENTHIEAVKGGLSDAFKRAGVKWGIGRYMYDLSDVWVPLKNQYGDFDPPQLPKWALPANDKTTARVATSEAGSSPAPASGGAAPDASPAAGVPSYTDVEIPDWYEPFNEERKSLGIGVEALEAVLGKRPSIPNIREWLNAEDGRTPEKLLSMAADRKAAV